jgi:O-antigen ligase
LQLVNLKALVVVLTFASVMFWAAKPLCLRFTAPEDFARRRTVWLVLTSASFLLPSFWLYLLIAAPLIAWAAKKDSTPLALYVLLMFVLPPMDVRIPTIGIGQLFDLSNLRILGFLVLLPAIWRQLTAPDSKPFRFSIMDVILLSYGLLLLVLFVPYESITNTMRRAFLFGLDLYLAFFAFSRLLTDREKLADTMGALCLMAALFAPIAAFESLRGWLLYVGIGDVWGSVNRDAYLMRGDSLRAQAAAGHSLTLGYIFAMAIGCWMYLRSTQVSKTQSTVFFVVLCAALAFTYARGPWLTGVFVVIAFSALARGSVVNAMKSALLLAVAVALLGLTPFGARIIDTLPYIGSQGQDSVAYREQLTEVSWSLIKQNPFFGSPFVLMQMEELRPGEGGIIDLVNGFLQVALFYGLVGLTLFLSLFGVGLAKAYVKLREARAAGDHHMILIGSSLIAGMLATFVFMATAGSSYMQWMWVGLLASYSGAQVAGTVQAGDHRSVPFRIDGDARSPPERCKRSKTHQAARHLASARGTRSPAVMCENFNGNQMSTKAVADSLDRKPLSSA